MMKKRRLKVEYVSEYAKDLTYEGNRNKRAFQPVVFGEQAWRVERLQRDGLEYVVTDSPLALSLVYANPNLPKSFSTAVYDIFNSYTNVNVLLTRRHRFEYYGRNNTPESAEGIRNGILKMLNDYSIPYFEPVYDRQAQDIVDKVLELHPPVIET